MSSETPNTRPQPESSRLQILTTEHWSLLATRSLTYTEALSRVTIFLAILSGAMVALALVAQVDHFGPAFIAIAIFLLAAVMFTGIATIGRLNMLNRDDFRWVIGMNRIRNAYLQMHPDLEPHFVTSFHDDVPGALQTLGIDDLVAPGQVGSSLHLIQTLPGMLTVIVAAVGGAIGALITLALGGAPLAMVAATAIGFVLVLSLMRLWARRSMSTSSPSLEPRFPTPVEEAMSRER
jgi:hypothetical protein